MLSSFDFGNLAEALLLGIALSMDAMAVTLSNSLCESDMPMAKKLSMPALFGIFQMAMPIAGFFGGRLIASVIEAYAGIVSLVILAFVGGKMVVEAARELRAPEECATTRLGYATIFFEAIATSIDAFVVGVAFAARGVNVVLYSSTIGVCTVACCAAMLVVGRRVGERFGTYAQVMGGLVLIAIGIKAFVS